MLNVGAHKIDSEKQLFALKILGIENFNSVNSQKNPHGEFNFANNDPDFGASATA